MHQYRWSLQSIARTLFLSGAVALICAVMLPSGQIQLSAQTLKTTSQQTCNGAPVPAGEFCCPNGNVIPIGAMCTNTPPGPPSPSISYPSGWVIVGGPSGTNITGNSGPLYSFPAGATGYQVLSPGSALQAGTGYWAYFPSSGAATQPTATQPVVTLPLPPGQWVLIGNPGNGPATVSGAETVFTYAPGVGYQETNTLAPGAGAWVYSSFGGEVAISSSAS